MTTVRPTDQVFAASYDEVREIRATAPERIPALLAARRRRPFVPSDGRLMIVAADHPARGALAAGGRTDAMASRPDLLDRLTTALARPGVDGILGTADILEDLLLLGALEDKVVMSSMNRGGIQGATFELDDRQTGFDVQSTVESRFDGIKTLTRVDLDDWTPIYDRTELPGYYVAIGTSGNQFKNAPVVGQFMRTIIDRVENGADHDTTPLLFTAPHTGATIDLGAFSRQRPVNAHSSGTVLG
ncbi:MULTISPECIES: Cgl0159 family (beta/alpha)8-fold protein [Pseudonocardia]|uniref:Cgl0159-like domain-containing protein n=2 Tax=Pseudonocardia TaxID=1847 RepID=A0A1Y2MZU3_PSEAH|nr:MULTISPECIES: hypothetical protein [Pseudonocardia]OSY40723.1 hypothetical protein BG845_02481 [Pseudonocardia autotrophica]TDN71970.1 hypothetical protein C8E95_1005 [Pseudonocardia autotrophica]BBG02657.1 hypothetical protein Pdca_38660 [Pseudonocardia autotrophica]GEC24716.1 hypothetical protein PSA01_17450 [Pseudonocardia saturnea]